MIHDDVIELLALLDRFTRGEDQSRYAADAIEGLVLECCTLDLLSDATFDTWVLRVPDVTLVGPLRVDHER